MSAADQIILDVLVPHGRVKFTLAEVAVILGVDGHPLSIRTVRSMLENGQLGGYRLALSARPGEEQRIKQEFVLATDLILYLLRHRKLEAVDHLARLLRLIDGLGPDGLDAVLRHTTALRARAARRA